MNTSGMCNVTEFAAKCGVSIQTISRWVLEGSLKPGLSVNGVHYFDSNALLNARRILLQRKKPVAYLAVLVADNKEELTKKREVWDELQRNVVPRGNNIKGLAELMQCLDEPTLPTEEVIVPGVKLKLAHNMVNDIRSEVKRIAFGGADICEDARKLPVDFYLGMAFGKELDPEHLGIYQGLSITSFYSPVEIRSRCQQSLRDIAIKYGFYDTIKLNKWSLEQIYYDGESLLTSEASQVNPKALKAKREYEPKKREVEGKAKLAFINQIASQGYYTVIEAVGSLTQEQKDFITNAVLDGDYTSIYFSSRNILDEDSLRDISSAVRVNKLKFIVADELDE